MIYILLFNYLSSNLFQMDEINLTDLEKSEKLRRIKGIRAKNNNNDNLNFILKLN